MFETGRTALELNPTKILSGVVVGTLLLFTALYWSFWYGWMGLIVAIGIFQLFQDLERTRLIKGFARDAGLTFIGNSLPTHFPMHYTSSRRAHSIRRVVIGDDILFFDCAVGRGKGSRGRTVVGGRGEPSAFGWARFRPDVEIEQAGQWTLVFGSNRLLGLEEIKELISGFGARGAGGSGQVV